MASQVVTGISSGSNILISCCKYQAAFNLRKACQVAHPRLLLNKSQPLEACTQTRLLFSLTSPTSGSISASTNAAKSFNVDLPWPKPQTSFRSFRTSSHIQRGFSRGDWQQIHQQQEYEQHVARPVLVDTLALVRKFEEAGMDTAKAEALTSLMSDLLTHTQDRMTDTFITRVDFEKAEIRHESSMQLHKHDFKLSHDHEIGKLKQDIDSLKVECDKIKAEIRYEIDKVKSGQRLDLNLERGRVRDELKGHDDKLTSTTMRLEKDINAMRTQIEAMKNEVIKYSVGTIVSTAAVGLGLIRIFM